MSSIGTKLLNNAEVGVATKEGRSYFRITSLLNKIRVPYVDVILGNPAPIKGISARSHSDQMIRNLKIVVTTRKERLQIVSSNVVCVEDLGDDVGVAKERLFSMLYPIKDSDWFVVGIDPGERTGVVAFMSHLEVESLVFASVDETVNRVSELINNAPMVKKVVKIGSGIPLLADQIAKRLELRYRQQLRIQLVDERGTSALNSRAKARIETRDQRSAKLIAFREGRDYTPAA